MKKIILALITIISIGIAENTNLEYLDVDMTIKAERGDTTYVAKYIYLLADSTTAVRYIRGISKIDAIAKKQNAVKKLEIEIKKATRKRNKRNALNKKVAIELKALNKQLKQVKKWKVN